MNFVVIMYYFNILFFTIFGAVKCSILFKEHGILIFNSNNVNESFLLSFVGAFCGSIVGIMFGVLLPVIIPLYVLYENEYLNKSNELDNDDNSSVNCEPEPEEKQESEEEEKQESEEDYWNDSDIPKSFLKPIHITAELAEFLGVDPDTKLPRNEITHKIYKYINENNLKIPENKYVFIPDEKLSKLFELTPDVKLTYNNLQKYLSKHCIKIQETDNNNNM